MVGIYGLGYGRIWDLENVGLKVGSNKMVGMKGDFCSFSYIQYRS